MLLKEKICYNKDFHNDVLLNKISVLIEEYPTCYELVRYYCEAVKSRKCVKGYGDEYDVCKVCAAIVSVKDGGCKHYMHGKYKLLRSVREQLKNRILEYQNKM